MNDAYLCCVSRLARHLDNRDAEILDFGCGAGLAGVALAGLGYRTVDGIDRSARMLVKARRTGVYRTLMEACSVESIDLPERSYDAIVAAQVFVTGDMAPTVPEDLVCLLRAGGLVSLAMPANNGFSQNLERLVAAGDVLQMEGTWDSLIGGRETGSRFIVLGTL